ncbi:superoxide dismutase, Ni [Candidatus Daviesbacteria bacterium]|nr:superoxide dismutase, Ni [Candidatus Daviesbacteria bacterium]
MINFLLKLLPSRPVYAHCDIPCGIYDPHQAQLAAKTVLAMVQKLKEIKTEPGSPEELQARNNFVRMVKVKEEHAELCKREVLILWTDYFKSEHLEKFPHLHELVWKTTKLCSENKRAVDGAKAQELVEAVDKVAEVFAETKK